MAKGDVPIGDPGIGGSTGTANGSLGQRLGMGGTMTGRAGIMPSQQMAERMGQIAQRSAPQGDYGWQQAPQQQQPQGPRYQQGGYQQAPMGGQMNGQQQPMMGGQGPQSYPMMMKLFQLFSQQNPGVMNQMNQQGMNRPQY